MKGRHGRKELETEPPPSCPHPYQPTPPRTYWYVARHRKAALHVGSEMREHQRKKPLRPPTTTALDASALIVRVTLEVEAGGGEGAPGSDSKKNREGLPTHRGASTQDASAMARPAIHGTQERATERRASHRGDTCREIPHTAPEGGVGLPPTVQVIGLPGELRGTRRGEAGWVNPSTRRPRR